MNANFLSVFKNIRNILVVLAGNALYALAVVTFILPGGIITGGTTGLALAADPPFSTRLPWRSGSVSLSCPT